MMRKYLTLHYVFFLLAVLVLANNCAGLAEKDPLSRRWDRSAGRLILYLNGPEHAGQNVGFELDGVAVFNVERGWEELPLVARIVRSEDILGRQLVLSEVDLPSGSYDKIRFRFNSAQLLQADRAKLLSTDSSELEVEFKLRIVPGEATPVFVNWNIDRSVKDGFLFSPAFNIKAGSRGISSRLAYITNRGSDSVSVIDREIDEVVSVISTGRGPSGIAVGNRKNRLRVYVTNADSNSITVIDPTVNHVEQTIPLTSGAKPVAITAAQAASGKEYLFVANYDSNTISIIDGDSYREIAQARVGIGPFAILAEPLLDTISTVGLTAAQLSRWRSYRDQYINVYVANRGSNTVSVIVFNPSVASVQDAYTINVGWDPVALDIDTERAWLYVANANSNTVSILNILDIIDGDTGGAETDLANVGTGGTDIVADPFFARVYLLKRNGELVFLQTPSTISSTSTITAITGLARIGGRPQSMAMDTEGRKIYVLDGSSGTVHVVDKTLKRTVKTIPVGANPYEIAIVPY
ncbi:MAG: YncE family protein [Pseudomonadota bacterium]